MATPSTLAITFECQTEGCRGISRLSISVDRLMHQHSLECQICGAKIEIPNASEMVVQAHVARDALLALDHALAACPTHGTVHFTRSLQFGRGKLLED